MCLWSFWGIQRIYSVCVPEGEGECGFYSLLWWLMLSTVRFCWRYSLCDGRNGQVDGTIFLVLYTQSWL